MADDGRIFISYAEEDEEIAVRIGEGLDNAGYKTWYYERDGLPGVNFVEEELNEINRCRAFLLIISEDSIGSRNVDIEVYRAFNLGKPIMPLLCNITRSQFAERCQKWDMIIGATRTISISKTDVSSIISRIVRGLEALGVHVYIEPEEPVDSDKKVVEKVEDDKPSIPVPIEVKKPEEYKAPDRSNMVLIPAGEFQMGDKELGDAPVHKVYLDAFWIDKYLVTNAQYKKFLDANKGHRKPDYWDNKDFNAPDHPVVGVSWEDAKAYADWIGKRLPTEAEWEKAARGGEVGKKYVWGDEWPPLDRAGNFGNIEGYRDDYRYTSPVGKFKANGYGLYDMAGNVLEWCADRYNEDYYKNSLRENPKGPDTGNSRVLRGGSWVLNDTYGLRVAVRLYDGPSVGGGNVGFRCVSQD